MNINSFYKPSLVRWLTNALFDWMVIAGMVFLCDGVSWWFLPLALLVVGNRQHALAILGHDGGHWLVSQNRFVNDWVTRLFSFGPLMIGMRGYREFHFKHHRTVGTEEDPERKHKIWASPEFDLPAEKKDLVKHFVKDLFGLGWKHVFFAFTLLKPADVRDIIPSIVWWLIVGLSLWWVGLLVPFGIIWVGSIYTGFWACFRLRVWTEHQGIEGTHRIECPLWLRILACPHYTYYHWEHHDNPTVPFYLLPRYRLEIKKGDKILNVDEVFSDFYPKQENHYRYED